jgi:hypothetical protein
MTVNGDHMARYLVMLVVSMAGLGLAASVLSATPPGSPLSGSNFTEVAATQPAAALSAEDRAASMKQHLERWLEVHRPDLSNHAQSLTREAIALVTPEMYSRAPTEAQQQQTLLLGQQLACALGHARAGTLMQRDRPPQRISLSFGDSTREWIDWFVECAGR